MATADIDSGRWWPQVGVWAVVMVTVASGLAAANVIVDPRAEFGTGHFRPLVTDDVTIKLQLASQRPGPWDALVLGSSRSITIDPEALANGSHRSFNWAISSGTPPAMESLYRYVLESHGAPKTVYLGIDPEWLVGNEYGGGLATSKSSEIIESGHDSRTWSVGRALGTLSLDYLGDSQRSARFAMLDSYPAGQYEYLASGERRPLFWETEPIDRADRPLRIINHAMMNLIPRYETEILGERKAALESLLAVALAHSQEVVVFLPPVSSIAVEALPDRTLFDAVRTEIGELVSSMCGAGLAFADLTNVERFAGDELGFYDSWHFVDENQESVTVALREVKGCT